MAAPVSFIRWIPLLSPRRMSRLSQVRRTRRRSAVQRGSFSRCRCTDNHEAGSARLILLKEVPMRFYKQPHAFYAGIDLHARSMFTHILDHAGATVFERDLPAGTVAFLNAVAPYRAGLVVGVEGMFARSW